MNKAQRASDIEELLERGVSEFIDPEGVFQKKLTLEPQKVVIKFGVDPTRPDIHLGHAVVLRKLRKFQDLGCKVVFLIGDITAQIGDPTGKSKVRPEVDRKAIEENMKTYLDQVGKILNTDSAVFSWIRNSDWFLSMNDVEGVGKTTINFKQNAKTITLPELPANNVLVKAHIWEKSRMQKGKIVSYTFLNVLSVLRQLTLGRLVERDMFQARLKDGEAVFMNELLYSVLQGIDSAALAQIYGSCDLEVGGSDQTFNMLLGRDVMKLSKQEPQAVLAFEILPGLDGKEKMSKSLDNYIAITDLPAEMYGKIMSLPDALITTYFTLCTYTPREVIAEIEQDLEKGRENPRDIKMRLGREIVEMYHGREAALSAEESFVQTFQKKGIPEDMPTVEISSESALVDVLLEAGIISSKTEFRRLVDDGAIYDLDSEEPVTNYEWKARSARFRIGKRRFLNIIVRT